MSLLMRTKRGREKSRIEQRSLQAGQRLAEWFNSRSADDHPVAKAILEMQDAIEFARLARADVWREEDDPEGAQEARELAKRNAKIRRVTKKYPIFFDFCGLDPHPDNFFLELRPLGRSRQDVEGCLALADWKALADGYAQPRLQRCALAACNLYYYARRVDQRFHSPECKEADPERKRKQRMRKAKDYRDGLAPAEQTRLDEMRRAKNKRLFDELRDALIRSAEREKGRGRVAQSRDISRGGSRGNL